MDDGKYPVFFCEERETNGRKTWRFWCPFCKSEHSHGALEGHRVAHCHKKESPLKASGYIIKRRKT